MNKNLVLGGVVVLLLAGGAYAMQSKKNPTSKPQTATQTASEASEFASAIESGKPTICTMTKDADTVEYSIKGKKMRIKTASTTSDDKGVSKTTIGHMVSDEKFFYTWDDATKQGSKMSLDLPSSSPTASIAPVETAPKFDSAEDYDNLKSQGYTISCKASIIDDSVFTPPSDVKFFDPTEMMKAFPSPNADGSIDMKKLEELQKQYENQ